MNEFPSYLRLCIVPFSKKENNKSYSFMNRLFKKLGSTTKFSNSIDYNGNIMAIRIEYNSTNYADIQYYLSSQSFYLHRGYKYFNTYEDFIIHIYNSI